VSEITDVRGFFLTLVLASFARLFSVSSRGLKARRGSELICLVHNEGGEYAHTSSDDRTAALQFAALRRARRSRVFEGKGPSGGFVSATVMRS